MDTGPGAAHALSGASQVTGLAWSGEGDRELLSSHGFNRNQLSLWKYPSMQKVADLEGHTGRIIGISQSPDASVVISAGADETLRFWKVFTPVVPGHSEPIGQKSLRKTLR